MKTNCAKYWYNLKPKLRLPSYKVMSIGGISQYHEQRLIGVTC